MYVSSCHDDWDEFIDFVVFAYNTSHQESTSVSLLYGREAVLPIDVVLGNNSNPIASGDDPSERIRNLAGHLETIRRIVRKRLDAEQNRQKERYDDHRKNVSFAVGSLVWIYRPYRKKGRSEKLLHRYHGPFKIVRKVSDLHYIVAPISGRRKLQERVHVANLKPCLQRRLTPLSKPAVTASNTINEKTSVLREIATVVASEYPQPHVGTSSVPHKSITKSVNEELRASEDTAEPQVTKRITRSQSRAQRDRQKDEGCT